MTEPNESAPQHQPAVLVVTHYFPPEVGAPQARLSEFAKYWVVDGSDVTVLTGMPNHPTGIIPEEYRGSVRRIEEHDGYRIVRTWLYATPNEGIAKKTLGHVSFMISSVVLGFRKVGHPDLIVVSSPTFFSIFSGWLLARLKKARLIVEVRDLWPALFVELGVLRNRLIIRALERLELAAYRASDAVVVVSDGFRDNLVRRGILPDKIHTIRNGVDLGLFRPDDSTPNRGTKAAMSASKDVVVLYAGAHGLSQGLTTVADAAAELRDEAVRFLFVGEGAAKAALEARVSELGLKKVELRPSIPREEIPRLLAAADICLVPLKDIPLFTTFIPSKIFEYLAMKKAVVGSVRGEPATILSEAGALVVEPEDSSALAGAIRALARDPERRREMGERGREYVRLNFDRRSLAGRYRDLIKTLVCDLSSQTRV